MKRPTDTCLIMCKNVYQMAVIECPAFTIYVYKYIAFSTNIYCFLAFLVAIDQKCTGHQAFIGHQQLSDTVSCMAFFCTRDNRVNFAGGRGILVNSKIRRNKLEDIQEIDMLTFNKGSSVWISKF